MPELEGEFHFSSADSSESSSSDPSETPSGSGSADITQPATLPPEHAEEASAADVPVRKPIRFYSALCEYPNNVSFDTQDLDEEIILLIRRSFATNIPWIFLVVLLSLVPFIIMLLPFPLFFQGLSASTYLVVLFFYYLVLFGVILVNFSLWYFNVGIVTNKRVVDVDIYGILSREVAETRLSLIQDVSYEQTGFLRSLFHYGDVFVQTAGTVQNVEFDRIPRPMYVAQTIGDLLGKRSRARNK